MKHQKIVSFYKKSLAKEIHNFKMLFTSTNKNDDVSSLNPEQIHQQRVCLRRLRTLLSLISLKKEKKTIKQLSKFMKKINSEIAIIRDFDIIILKADIFHLECEDFKIWRKILIHDLRLRNAKAKYIQELNLNINYLDLIVNKIENKNKNKKTKLDIAKKSVRKLKFELKNIKKYTQVLKHTLKQNNNNNNNNNNNMKKKNNENIIINNYKNCPEAKVPLHSIRIHLKKMRYTSEAFHQPTQNLKIWQTKLGDLHDLEILRSCYPDNKYIINKENLIRNKIIEQLPPFLEKLEIKYN